MVSVADIGGAISGLKGLLDIAKGLKALNDEATVNEVKIALQSAVLEAQGGLLAAQEAQAANLRHVGDLEQEIVRLKDWSAERERYQLVDVYRGSLTYMPKPGMENGQPAHWLCANCFDQERKSYLQFKGQDEKPTGGRGMESTYACDACKASIKVSYRTKPAWPGEGDE